MFQGVVTAFGTLVVVVVILYLTYVCTRYMGRNMRFKGYTGNSRYVRVIDQVVLGQESSVVLVNVSGRIFLLGITSGQVNMLTEIPEGELTQIPVQEMEKGMNTGLDFKDIIDRLKNRKK